MKLTTFYKKNCINHHKTMIRNSFWAHHLSRNFTKCVQAWQYALLNSKNCCFEFFGSQGPALGLYLGTVVKLLKEFRNYFGSVCYQNHYKMNHLTG